MSDIYAVYNRCQYRRCKNGKYNGTRMFRFPFPLERQKKWIECAGNPQLKNWKQNTVRRAGLCYLHFRKGDILIRNNKMRLIRDANPIHWMDPSISDDEDEEEEEKYLENNGETECIDTEDVKIKMEFEEFFEEMQEEVREPVPEIVYLDDDDEEEEKGGKGIK